MLVYSVLRIKCSACSHKIAVIIVNYTTSISFKHNMTIYCNIPVSTKSLWTYTTKMIVLTLGNKSEKETEHEPKSGKILNKLPKDKKTMPTF